jgi:uncharacterized protein YndB with AHSA1/START domain
MTTNHPDFVISRTFDAPRDRVWQALTVPEQMQAWFTPKGFTSRAVKFELRPGGMYHYCMTSADGHEMWGKATYREIEAPKRITYINAFSNAEGGTTRHPMSATWPLEMLTTFTLEEALGNKTALTVRWTLLDGVAEEEAKTFNGAHDGMRQGWGGTFDHLAEFLAKK